MSTHKIIGIQSFKMTGCKNVVDKGLDDRKEGVSGRKMTSEYVDEEALL
jgi:hypothetical protein